MRLLFIFALITNVAALNIVFYQLFVSKSHLQYMETLISLLTERGHTVDLIIAELNSAMAWQGSSKVRNHTIFGFDGESPWLKIPHLSDPFDQNPDFDLTAFYVIIEQLCEAGIRQEKTVEFLKNGNYDAIIFSDYEWCPLILAHAAGIETTIAFSAVGLSDRQALFLGLPSPVSCVAGLLEIDGSFSFTSKVQRLYRRLIVISEVNAAAARQTALARKYYTSKFPDVNELARRIDVIFVNSNEIIEIPRTISSKVQYIGGINLPKLKDVPERFREVLSLSNKGNILVSFGTQVPISKFNLRIRKALINAFKRMPDYGFIWKYALLPGDRELIGNSSNIHIFDWIPQNDLLHDKRVVAFITHSGLNSYIESSYAGVPIVSIPLIVDQFSNARAAVRIGTGIQLDKTTLDEKMLFEALNKVLTSKRYMISAKDIAKKLVNKPSDPKDIFLDWVEFAATHKGLHELISLSESRMGFIEYYCIDLLATILCFAVVCLILTFYCLKRLRSGFKTVVITIFKSKSD